MPTKRPTGLRPASFKLKLKKEEEIKRTRLLFFSLFSLSADETMNFFNQATGFLFLFKPLRSRKSEKELLSDNQRQNQREKERESVERVSLSFFFSFFSEFFFLDLERE